MLTVAATPTGARFTEFVRVDIIAEDDGTSPEVTGPFEILLTTDGSIPSDSNSATSIRRSPILRLPLSGPTTLKFFARPASGGGTATDISIEFYDVIELLPVGAVRVAPDTVTNYTLRIDEDGDLVRTNGRYEIVWGVDKCVQDIREIILVEDVPSNGRIGDRTLPQFGSSLNRVLGESLPVGFVANDIRSSIFNALSALTALQRQERVPFDEQIRRILNVTVSTIDPTTYKYRFAVETVGGATVNDSGSITVTGGAA